MPRVDSNVGVKPQEPVTEGAQPEDSLSDDITIDPEDVRPVREFEVLGLAFVRDRFVVPISGESENIGIDDRFVTLHHVPPQGPMPVLDEVTTAAQRIDVYARTQQPLEVVGDELAMLVGDGFESLSLARFHIDTGAIDAELTPLPPTFAAGSEVLRFDGAQYLLGWRGNTRLHFARASPTGDVVRHEYFTSSEGPFTEMGLRVASHGAGTLAVWTVADNRSPQRPRMLAQRFDASFVPIDDEPFVVRLDSPWCSPPAVDGAQYTLLCTLMVGSSPAALEQSAIVVIDFDTAQVSIQSIAERVGRVSHLVAHEAGYLAIHRLSPLEPRQLLWLDAAAVPLPRPAMTLDPSLQSRKLQVAYGGGSYLLVSSNRLSGQGNVIAARIAPESTSMNFKIIAPKLYLD